MGLEAALKGCGSMLCEASASGLYLISKLTGKKTLGKKLALHNELAFL